ncbi:hypothetical protein K8640_29485 [Myxococcus sp. XM-1-1-1]|uniref:hypothetical protein n=1 Tax=Myxococcus sp. XM-1-1-1 TaxID=2874602 RepID=UPI001CBE203B|nr:hypothetical protein [Myxococcus sp. XM-1-1-1]MBZ4412362.1 hypothetical protein [Myxococcus sp. XM-1-1-1]
MTMTTTASPRGEEHELALLLGGRCRRCAERIPGGTALRGRPCPRCAEATLPSPEDREVLHQLATQRATVHLSVAVVGVAAAALVASWVPLLTSLLLVAALVWLRVTLVTPALQLLSLQRKLVARWTLRLAAGCFVALSVLLLELLTLVPGLGALAKVALSAGQVAVAGLFARRYLAWQTGREARGVPIAWWELGLLVAWMLLLLAFTTASVLLVLYVLQSLGFVKEFLVMPVGG